MMRHRLAVSFVLMLSGCVAHGGGGNPINIARPAFGGEAGFYGSIELQRGCIVTGGDRPATVLFDPGVKLSEDRTRIIDPRAQGSVRLDVPIQGGAALLRENGKGWPIADIESFFGVTIPAGCPTKDVMRLHGMKEQ
ncbi:hypothetical protein [Qipengyuania sp. SM2507]